VILPNFLAGSIILLSVYGIGKTPLFNCADFLINLARKEIHIVRPSDGKEMILQPLRDITPKRTRVFIRGTEEDVTRFVHVDTDLKMTEFLNDRIRQQYISENKTRFNIHDVDNKTMKTKKFKVVNLSDLGLRQKLSLEQVNDLISKNPQIKQECIRLKNDERSDKILPALSLKVPFGPF
jgi:hypothetical protein